MHQHTRTRHVSVRGRPGVSRRAGAIPVQPLERRVLLSATTTTLSAPSATLLGQPLVVTATVVDASGAAVPGGSVDLYNDGTSTGLVATANAAGVATFTFGPGNALYAGTYGLSAAFPGTTTEAASTSAAAVVTISLPTFTTTADGLQVATVTAGTGPGAVTGQTVTAEYTGFYQSSGAQFDESSAHSPGTFSYTLNATPEQVITGFDEGTAGIEAGETRVLVIPSNLGYQDGKVRVFVIRSVAAGPVTTGAAATLSLSGAPTTATAGQPIGTPLVVNVDDANLNLVGTDTSAVTIAIATGPAGGTLGGTTTVAATGGQATFSDLMFSVPGTYTLTASDGSLAATTSAAIVVAGGTVATPSPLAPTLGKVTLPAAVVAGAKIAARVPVVITNGGAALKGAVSVNLYADAGTALDGGRVLVAQLPPRTLSLKAGGSHAVAFTVRSLPAALGAGTYHLIAEVVDPSGLTATTATTQTVTVAAPFVQPMVAVTTVTPATIAAGKSASVRVTITNGGNVTASGISLTLAASADGVTPVAGAALATVRSGAKLAAGKTATFRLRFKPATASLAAGMYFADVAVTLGSASASVVGGAFTVG